MATITVGTGGSAAALIEQTWRPTLSRQANEEERIVNTFDDGNEGVEKFAGTLNVRKILRIAPTKYASTGTDVNTNVTYTANTELNVTVKPTMAVGAVELSQATLRRLLAAPALQKAYKEQLLAGVIAQKDADGGQLASSLTVNIKGSNSQAFDKAFLLDGIGTLIESARELYQPGKAGWAFLHYHPRQYKYVHSIPEIVSAYIRGDNQGAIDKGWVWEAYGLSLSESGNVYTVAGSPGTAHNLLHIKQAMLIAYNQHEDFLPTQEYQMVVRMHCFAEYGVATIWDEYAVDMQTAMA